MKMILKQKLDKRDAALWSCLLGTLCIFYFCLMYPDINVTHHHSLTLLDCVFTGDIGRFYSHTVENQFGGWAAVYYITVYIVFAIWNLPIWLLCKVGVITAQGRIALLWVKLLVFVSVLGCAFFLRQLLPAMKTKGKSAAVFLMLSSLVVVLPAFAMAQYDSLTLLMTLWGIYFYINEENISWKTLLVFSLAISLKLFALFPFVMLVLLKEKRILHILKDLIAGIAVSAIAVLSYAGDPGYKIAVSSFNDNMLNRLIERVIPGGSGGISLFFLGAMAVYIIAYYVVPKNKSDYEKYIAWLGTLFFFSFILFVNVHPQWTIMITPFLLLMILQNERNLKINLILETAMEISLVIIWLICYDWVFLQYNSFSYLGLKYLPIISDAFGIQNMTVVLHHFGIPSLLPAFYAIFAACGFALLIINNPWTKATEGNHYAENSFIKGVCLFRLLILIGYFLCGFLVTYIV